MYVRAGRGALPGIEVTCRHQGRARGGRGRNTYGFLFLGCVCCVWIELAQLTGNSSGFQSCLQS